MLPSLLGACVTRDSPEHQHYFIMVADGSCRQRRLMQLCEQSRSPNIEASCNNSMLRFVLKNNYAVQDVDDLKRVFQGRGDVDEVRSCSRSPSYSMHTASCKANEYAHVNLFIIVEDLIKPLIT
eukprot:1191867-Prorocentrum_minimum.AAC.1